MERLMNERIRQLAEQATSIVEMVSSYGYMSSYANFDREKFAELIVRECAEFADEHNEESEGVTLGVGRELKKHFGVEE